MTTQLVNLKGKSIGAVEIPLSVGLETYPFVIVWQGRFFTKWGTGGGRAGFKPYYTECDGVIIPSDPISREMERREGSD